MNHRRVRVQFRRAVSQKKMFGKEAFSLSVNSVQQNSSSKPKMYPVRERYVGNHTERGRSYKLPKCKKSDRFFSIRYGDTDFAADISTIDYCCKN
jgi:hypothetical protein